MDSDIYLNSLMTFDRKKEARRLERLNNIDLLFDFHNFTEFSQKIDYLIKKIGKENIFYKTDNPINYSYKEIYNTITKILKEINYEKYQYFYNKYENSISNPLSPLNDIEPIACQFLTEYAEYIIALSNKQISLPTIIEAAKVVKEKMFVLILEDYLQ